VEPHEDPVWRTAVVFVDSAEHAHAVLPITGDYVKDWPVEASPEQLIPQLLAGHGVTAPGPAPGDSKDPGGPADQRGRLGNDIVLTDEQLHQIAEGLVAGSETGLPLSKSASEPEPEPMSLGVARLADTVAGLSGMNTFGDVGSPRSAESVLAAVSPGTVVDAGDVPVGGAGVTARGPAVRLRGGAGDDEAGSVPTGESPFPSDASSSSVIPPFARRAPDPETFRFTGEVVGTHDSEIHLGPSGQRWLVKRPDPGDEFLTAAEEAVGRWQRQPGGDGDADLPGGGGHGSRNRAPYSDAGHGHAADEGDPRSEWGTEAAEELGESDVFDIVVVPPDDEAESLLEEQSVPVPSVPAGGGRGDELGTTARNHANRVWLDSIDIRGLPVVAIDGPVRLSEVLAEQHWWRLFLNPHDHGVTMQRYPQDPGAMYDNESSPGFQEGMRRAYRLVLDEPEVLAQRVDWDAYRQMHQMVTSDTAAALGAEQFDITGTVAGRLTFHFPYTHRLADDLVSELVGGRPLITEGNLHELVSRDTDDMIVAVGPRPWAPDELMFTMMYPADRVSEMVDEVFDRYYRDMDRAGGLHERLRAVGQVVRTLTVMHPFVDGNGRLNVNLLLPRLLQANGFRPVVTPSIQTLFNGGFSLEHIATALHWGQDRDLTIGLDDLDTPAPSVLGGENSRRSGVGPFLAMPHQYGKHTAPQ
jgi:hypothetical protein